MSKVKVVLKVTSQIIVEVDSEPGDSDDTLIERAREQADINESHVCDWAYQGDEVRRQ